MLAAAAADLARLVLACFMLLPVAAPVLPLLLLLLLLLLLPLLCNGLPLTV